MPATGYYKLETWGAAGGIALTGSGSTWNARTNNKVGYGAYSVGIVNLSKNNALYINVGGKGKTPTNPQVTYTDGGYNGGGQGGYFVDTSNFSTRGVAGGGSGGGATHIATRSGLLKDLSSYKATILIVSGGGGGSGYSLYNISTNCNTSGYGDGGNGGGITGVDGTDSSVCLDYYSYGGKGGSQTATGANGGHSSTRYDPLKYELTGGFGYSGRSGSYNVADNLTRSHGAGGGGGYYGGGSGGTEMASGESGAGGGGGSGYIGSSNLISGAGITKHMTCYSCTTSTDTATRTISNTNVSATATADYSKTGNGYARITYLGTSI